MVIERSKCTNNRSTEPFSYRMSKNTLIHENSSFRELVELG
jgi:hypothetical protein